MKKVIIIILAALTTIGFAEQGEKAQALTHFFANQFDAIIVDIEGDITGVFQHELMSLAKLKFDQEVTWNSEIEWAIGWVALPENAIGRAFYYDDGIYNLLLLHYNGKVLFYIKETE